jgi:hypothetical protein
MVRCRQLLVSIWIAVALHLLVRSWPVLHCSGGYHLCRLQGLCSRQLLIGDGTGVGVLYAVSCRVLRHSRCRNVVSCLYSLCSWELRDWVRNAFIMRLVLVWAVLRVRCAGSLLLSHLCAVCCWKLFLCVGADFSVLIGM